MPLYEYICDQCGCKFELLRSFTQMDDAAICPCCEQPRVRRLLSTFAAVIDICCREQEQRWIERERDSK